MNLETFFNQFDVLADAPNGVKKLRELILQLAVMGKLVPQDPNDEPASVLLEKIKAEKEKLVKEGKIRKIEKLPEINTDEVPYELPKGWQWVRLGNISQIVGGGTPKTHQIEYYSNSEIPWITPADLYQLKDKMISRGRRDITKLGLQKSSAQLLPQGSVVFSSRAPIGYVAIAANDLSTNQGFKSSIPFIIDMNEYIYYFLKSVAKQIDESASGTTFKEVSGKEVSLIKIPLPPLNEQHRIAAKVDQLMALCDELESRKHKKKQHIVHLGEVATSKLIIVSNSQEYEQNWRHITNNFDLIYSVPENIKQLRQAILQLAVMGKLVSQDLNDEPASVLLEKIKVEREKLVKEGKIRKSGTLPPIKPHEISVELPDSWEWVRLDEISDIGTGSTPLKTQLEYYDNGDIPWITSASTSQEVIEEAEFFITPKAVSECRLRIYPSGALIVALYGQGKTRGQISELKIAATINQACAAIVFFEAITDLQKYIKKVFEKKYDELRALAAGAAQPNLNVGKIKETLIPLPPLAEMKRIVIKIDQLMSLCDELETQLTQATNDRNRLIETAIRQVLVA